MNYYSVCSTSRSSSLFGIFLSSMMCNLNSFDALTVAPTQIVNSDCLSTIWLVADLLTLNPIR